MKRLFFGVLLLAVFPLASCKRKKPEAFSEIFLETDFACGKAASGAWHCWGGKYGDAPAAISEGHPPMREGGIPPRCRAESGSAVCSGKKVDGLADGAVVQVATGRAHACALLRDATIWCWGDNAFYQLADGTKDARDQPRMIQGVFGVRQIVASGDGTCARLGDGDMRCWGNNTHGQLAPQMHPRTAINVPTSIRH